MEEKHNEDIRLLEGLLLSCPDTGTAQEIILIQRNPNDAQFLQIITAGSNTAWLHEFRSGELNLDDVRKLQKELSATPES